MIKIRDNLYQGSLNDLSMYNLMIQKFDFIVCVAKELEEYLPTHIEWLDDKRTSFYCWGLVDDSIDQKEDIDIILDFMKPVLETNHKILVMCAAGMSRSPYICAKYLSITENKSMDDVYKELKELNPGIDDKSPLRCNDE
jgi:protein-tyrosine phosphatase